MCLCACTFAPYIVYAYVLHMTLEGGAGGGQILDPVPSHSPGPLSALRPLRLECWGREALRIREASSKAPLPVWFSPVEAPLASPRPPPSPPQYLHQTLVLGSRWLPVPEQTKVTVAALLIARLLSSASGPLVWASPESGLCGRARSWGVGFRWGALPFLLGLWAQVQEPARGVQHREKVG